MFFMRKIYIFFNDYKKLGTHDVVIYFTGNVAREGNLCFIYEIAKM